MAKTREKISQRMIVLGLLTWLVPGAGHWYLGQRWRAVTVFAGITLAFLTGIVIGGADTTVDLEGNTAWFFGQVWAGGYTLLTVAIGELSSAKSSYGKTLDLATIYTGIAGLLNILVILDVMARAAKPVQ